MAGPLRTILHVDMDAFYASVEERDRPELKGKPLIVGGTGGRGVVAAASYAVRCFGVHSAMPMAEALRRCPDAICIPPRMGRYQEVSAQVFEIFHDFTPLVEGLSLDEAFLDVTASLRLMGDGIVIATEVRRRIREATGLTASVGIGPNKLLAKIASDLNKPDGLCRIGSDNVHTILDRLPVQKLFGVGQKSLPGVQAAGIRTFVDLLHAASPAHGVTVLAAPCRGAIAGRRRRGFADPAAGGSVRRRGAAVASRRHRRWNTPAVWQVAADARQPAAALPERRNTGRLRPGAPL